MSDYSDETEIGKICLEIKWLKAIVSETLLLRNTHEMLERHCPHVPNRHEACRTDHLFYCDQLSAAKARLRKARLADKS